MKRVLILLLSAVLMTAALTGCSSGEEDALVSKTPFPEFSEVDIAGDEISSDIFTDYDATIVNFWNNGCGSCIAEMPELEELYQDFKERNINLIGVGTDSGESREQLDTAREILKEKGVTYHNISPDPEGDFYKDFVADISTYPTTYIVDSEGNIVCRIRWPGRGERAICRLFRQAAAAALPPAQSRNSAASADAGIPAARGAADGPSVPNPGTDRRGASDQHTAVGVTQNFPLDVGGNDINKLGGAGRSRQRKSRHFDQKRSVCMPRAENDSPDVPLHVGGMAPGLQGHDFIDLFGDVEQAGFVFQDQSNGADRLRVTAVIARNAKGAQRFPDDRVHGEHLLEICDEKIVRRKTAKPEKTTSLRKFDIFHCVGKLRSLSSRIWNPPFNLS